MKKLLIVLIILSTRDLIAQNDRVNDYNSIAWLQTFNTITLDKKWSLHLEYQWRRTDGLKYWQQSLLRIGANYKLHDNIILHAGYGWIETFPYGDYPIASAGTFPEHRLYEQISFRQPINIWTFLHRFRIEQRWLGKVEPGTDRKIEEWNFVHRFRYQFRGQLALWSKNEKQLYGALADEIFIQAGTNVGVNIFDQNRFFLLMGYKFNKQFTLEGGYLNQTLQQGSRVNDKIIMQRNNGWVLTSLLNL